MKNSPERNGGNIIRLIKTGVAHMKTTTTNIPPSHPPEMAHSLPQHSLRSIRQTAAVHKHGWCLTATRMFQRAEGRSVLLVFSAIDTT